MEGDRGIRRLAGAHAAFLAVSGAWPLIHMRSFEAVLGPKVDRWLVRTVSGLLIGNGITEWAAARRPETAPLAGVVALTTSLTLGTVDVRYGATGRISRMYLLDAVGEAAWICCWLRALARQGQP